MADPARKQTPDIEPDIRPSLRSIRGGGESTPDRANLQALNKKEEAGSSLDNDKSVDDQERNPSNVTKGPWDNKTTIGGSNTTEPSRRLSFIKKKGPLTAIIMSVLVGGSGIGFFLTGAIAPIAFFEAISGDLNDQLGALDIRSEYMARNKLISSEKSQAIKGCGKLSIRCKFATLSDKQIRKLGKAGIKVVASTETTKGILGGRTIPDKYIFHGKEYSPSEWGDMLKTNRQAQMAQRKANNMKYAGLSDKTFITRVLARFGVSFKPPELKGSPQDRMNALMNRSGVTDAKDIKFSKTTDKDGNPAWELDGDTDLDKDGKPKRTYTDAEKTSMEKAQARVVTAKPPSKVTKASVGALSALGYWDLACSISKMIGAASITAKIANQQELIKFAMPIASLAGQMKAGDITPQNAEALGKFFTDVDSRKYIADVSGTTLNANNELQPDVKINSSSSSEPSNNPNYGKSGMDSDLFRMSNTGQVAPPSPGRSVFSLGMGQNQLLAGFSNFADIASAITNVGDASACKFVQNGIVRGVGIIASIAIGAATFGTGTVVQAAIAGSLMIAISVLDTMMNNMLGGSLVSTDNLADAPVDRAAATWTGMSVAYGAAAQSRGLIPGNSGQLAQYQNEVQNPTKQDYIALDASEANPLDIYDQYSFIGSFARSLLGYTSSSISGTSALSNIASIVSGGLTSIFKSPVYAATIDESRFKQCDDQGYKDVGIDADVQCNVRYYMPSDDLKMDTDEVAAYMEENYVDAVTGLPPGYTPPQPAESQGAAMDFLNGTISQYVDTRNYVNDYGKYLDYCAYRTMPWGETFQEDPNGDMGDWQNGKNCMKQGAPYNYFRIYTLDKSIQEAEDDEGVDVTSTASPTARPENSVDRGRGWTIKNDIDYSSYACDPRTTDVGTYKNPRLGFTLRLCQITSFPSLVGKDINVDANVVSSLISTNLVNMFEAAKADGIQLGVSSGMRSVTNANYTDYSQHGRGLAVDIGSPIGGKTICYPSGGGYDTTFANACRKRPADDKDGKAVRWLDTNAEKYGFYNLRSEGWHWSAGEL